MSNLEQRNKGHENMKDKVFRLMSKDPHFCDDNTHGLASVLFSEEFGITLTQEHIRYLNSLDRARRNVLKHHPELDMRTKTKTVLEENDRQYYGESA